MFFFMWTHTSRLRLLHVVGFEYSRNFFGGKRKNIYFIGQMLLHIGGILNSNETKYECRAICTCYSEKNILYGLCFNLLECFCVWFEASVIARSWYVLLYTSTGTKSPMFLVHCSFISIVCVAAWRQTSMYTISCKNQSTENRLFKTRLNIS